MESKSPALVGSTGETYNCPIAKTLRDERQLKQGSGVEDDIQRSLRAISEEENETNYFKSAQW